MDFLCLGLNPNCSSRIKPRSPASYKILANRILSKNEISFLIKKSLMMAVNRRKAVTRPTVVLCTAVS